MLHTISQSQNFLFCPTNSDKEKLQVLTLKKLEHVQVIFFYSTNWIIDWLLRLYWMHVTRKP